MNPLRVLHVTPYSSGTWAYGGIPRLADAMASGLAARGHRVTVCTTDAGDALTRLQGAPRRTRPWPVETRTDGVRVRVFPNISNRLAYHAQLFLPIGFERFLRAHADRFDIAHLHACRNVPGILAGRHLRAAGIPFIVAPNGTAPVIERRQAAKHVFDLVAGRRLLQGAARVLAVTEAERRQLLALGVPPASISLVPNPLDLRELPLRATSPGRQSAAPVVAYLGKLTPRKRLDVLIRAFASLRADDPRFAEARLIIAGNDMGAGTAARALVTALGLEACTTFPGLLRGEARADLLAAADVLAYATEDEIFGLVPLEALVCGTPVVVSDDSGCGEIIGQIGGGLVVPPGDVAALAGAIAGLAGGRCPDVDVAAAGARVRARFSHDVVCEQLESVYREVIQESNAPGTFQPSVPAVRLSLAGRHTTPVPATTRQPRVAAHGPARIQVSAYRMLAVIPAHNEAANLPRVVADLRAHYPHLDILVVDDGSCDGTPAILDRLGVRWLAWEERRGIGAAIRAGLRYAARSGFDLVVRVDADGQHGADDIAEVVRPIHDARAEVVLGSRYTVQQLRPRGAVALIQWLLDGCLSTITRRRITDATSGFCALGPHAIRMLAEHHPTGYPEPELRLFLSRNALRVLEVPVRSRVRLSGRTSLTPVRMATAAARVLLAMVIVPLRPTVHPPGD